MESGSAHLWRFVHPDVVSRVANSYSTAAQIQTLNENRVSGLVERLEGTSGDQLVVVPVNVG